MGLDLPTLNRRRHIGGGSAPVPAFSPSTLYSSGSQGIWLDPSDLSTMFSDRAGTTPVTAPGQLVGLRLDKSKGLVLGPELVSNPGPFTTTTGWSHNGTSLTASGDNLVFVSSSATAYIYATVTGLTVGATYTVTTNVVGFDAGGTLRADDAFNLSSPVSSASLSVGEVRLVFVANLATMYVGFRGFTTAGQGITFSSFSVRELAGNHAVAPTDAARPMYGVEPKGGRRNIELQTQNFANSYWVKGGGSLTATNVIAPDGTATACTLTGAGSGNVSVQAPGAVAIGLFSQSWYVKAATETKCEIWNAGGASLARFDLSAVTATTTGGGGSFITSVGGGWFRIGTFAAAYNGYTRLLLGHGAPTLTTSMHIWGVQVEAGTSATAYQRVTIAEDVTEAGVPTCHYCRYDGANNSMSTSAIDFTATDKMSVVVGAWKSSNALTGMLLEISNSLAVGSLNLVVPQVTATGVMRANSRGTVSAFVDGPTQAAPASFLATIQTDIANDNLLLRLNGTQVAQATTDQGTGNFGSHPLFIGRRNNATLPFNGRDFGIIIVGKTASAGEITDTETWLAAKTAQVTL